jgi:hypothetical protein
VEKVKSALSRLVTRVEVHEVPRPNRKRPGAELAVHGNLETLLQLTGKAESVNSPGGILTLLIFRPPARRVSLQGRRHARGEAMTERRAAVGAA